MGFGDAFRASIRPIHVRQDLASLPWIAVHTKALWVPVLITVASTIAVIGTQGGTLSQFMFAYFIQTPAIGGVFIAGFLAPRASWLLGVVVGLVSALCYSILVLGFSSTIYPAAPLAGHRSRRGGIGVRPVAGHRWLLRCWCSVVSPLPCLLEPEPRPQLAEPEAHGARRRRPDTQRDHLAEGWRQALTRRARRCRRFRPRLTPGDGLRC